MSRPARRTMGAVALLSLLALACGGPGESGPAPASPGTPSSQVGLSTASLDEAPAPPAWSANETMPGEEPVRPRAYPGAPPVIPHGIDAFLPITNDENNCLLCHQPGGEKAAGEPTPLPESHMVDLRRAPGEIRQEVAGARHNCLACHVPRSNAPPLVENLFTAAPAPPPGS